ncbi:phytanoyl-CoA dioxygenase family protein [Streptomyces rimosus]|uniref:phytanoyl-CoA dioxygenase family protein n=1 Tax=Streptomyces rimosus TaxID=1927 RepID=UPI00067ABD62|nr:phytanoyl-CoA dioxygenase family protein [Streptomyces rimosus]
MIGGSGPVSPYGWRGIRWGEARTLWHRLAERYRSTRTEIVCNPHHDLPEARAIVRSPQLLDQVCAAIGPNVAVERSTLVLKWPDATFETPWHQDGITDGLQLDPDRSVAAWLALTDITPRSGCLVVAPGAHCDGYRSHNTEPSTGAVRGQALHTGLPKGTSTASVTLLAGQGVLMDVRLPHRSGSNLSGLVRGALSIRFVAPGGIRMRDGSSPSLNPVSGTGWQPREGETREESTS